MASSDSLKKGRTMSLRPSALRSPSVFRCLPSSTPRATPHSSTKRKTTALREVEGDITLPTPKRVRIKESQINRKELTATRKKHPKPSAEEAHTYTHINSASDCLQQTKSPADHGASITHSQCISGRAVTSQVAIYKQSISMPKAAQHKPEYPWLCRPRDASWSTREDQYLVDATVQGIRYEQISEHLSNGSWIKRSIPDCEKRVAFHTFRAVGGTLLPGAWLFNDAPTGAAWPGMPVEEKGLIYKFKLTKDEYQELALFKYYGRYLYTRNFIFRDHISAARLRGCLNDMDQLDPVLFERRVNYFRSRTELRRRPYIQRVEAMQRAKKQEQERVNRRRERSAKPVVAVGIAKQEGEERAWLPRESYVQRLVAIEKAKKGGDEKAEGK